MSDDQKPPHRGDVVPGDAPEETTTALKRIPLTLTVRKDFDLFSDFLAEFGEHIYPEGMFIPSSRPRTKGAQVKVDFRTQDGFQILHATCEVVRSDEALPGTMSGMWVSFRVIDGPSRELIQRIYTERETGAGAAAKAAHPAPARASGSNTPDEGS